MTNIIKHNNSINKDKESFTINERYDLKGRIKANIATGIITIKIPVDSNIITSIKIGD